jgi:hypothetical protein
LRTRSCTWSTPQRSRVTFFTSMAAHILAAGSCKEFSS